VVQDVIVDSRPPRWHSRSALVVALFNVAVAAAYLRDGKDLVWAWVGIAMIWTAKAIVAGRRHVVVDAEGVHRRFAGATRTVRWEDVAAVEDRGTDRVMRARTRVQPHDAASLKVSGGGTTEDELAVRRAIRTHAAERGISVEMR
jgi:hypothetical protein